MTRIVVHEWISGGGLADTPAALRAELLPAGRAMRDALLADLLALPGLSVTVTDCADAPLLPGPAHVMRAAAGQAPLDFLAELAARHDSVWVVAPESDGLLARCQAVVGSARWLGCSAEAIAVASSKARMLRAWQAVGVCTPLAFAAAAGTQRWVVKPDDGAGAVATHTHASAAAAQAEAAARRAQGEAVVVEPWVDGPALSLSLRVPGLGEAPQLLSLNQQAIRLDAAGRVHFDGVHWGPLPAGDPRRPALQQLADATLRALPGLRGFVGIDLVWHAQRGPVAIELNPRVSCAYAGQSAQLGRNLAADLLADHQRWLAGACRSTSAARPAAHRRPTEAPHA